MVYIEVWAPTATCDLNDVLRCPLRDHPWFRRCGAYDITRVSLAHGSRLSLLRGMVLDGLNC